VDEVPDAEDWAAVAHAVRERMSELRMSKAALARETGLSETTIRYLGRSPRGHRRSVLVAISAVLRWRYDHLTNILHGQPEKNTPARTVAQASLQRLLRAHLGPLASEISRLKETALAIDKKTDALLPRGRQGHARDPHKEGITR
jgi:hypothetical protein